MDLKSTLKEGVTKISKAKAPSETMKALIAKVFSTRNSIHFSHWASKSYAEHEALGILYNAVVYKIDEIVEVYQGKYGLLSGVSAPASKALTDVCAHVKAEADWVGANRDKISNDCEAVSAILDELEAVYLKTLYKLENLK